MEKNNMGKDFVPYEAAIELKELGFDEPCFGYYKNDHFTFFVDMLNCNSNSVFRLYPTAPTFSQAFRWFRLGYGLFAQPNKTEDREGVWYYFIIDTKRTDVCEGSFTYEEAELSCLRKLIQIVKEKQ